MVLFPAEHTWVSSQFGVVTSRAGNLCIPRFPSPRGWSGCSRHWSASALVGDGRARRWSPPCPLWLQSRGFHVGWRRLQKWSPCQFWSQKKSVQTVFWHWLQSCSHCSEKHSLKYYVSIHDVCCKVAVAVASIDCNFAVMPMWKETCSQCQKSCGRCQKKTLTPSPTWKGLHLFAGELLLRWGCRLWFRSGNCPGSGRAPPLTGELWLFQLGPAVRGAATFGGGPTRGVAALSLGSIITRGAAIFIRDPARHAGVSEGAVKPGGGVAV